MPIVAPALGEEHRELIASLEREAKNAAELVTQLEQQLKEQRAKAREAQMKLQSAKVGVHRTGVGSQECRGAGHKPLAAAQGATIPGA